MKTMNSTARLSAAACFIASMMIAGCSHTPIAHGERFYDDKEPTPTGKFAQAQAAAGAKEDGMLYDRNFHGGELNSLGQVKLNLIAKGTTDGDSVFVYLNMPHDVVVQRQTAVTAYLKSHGIPESKIIVAEGMNPNTNTPAAYNINSLYKADSGSFNGQAIIDAAGGGAGAGGGAAGH